MKFIKKHHAATKMSAADYIDRNIKTLLDNTDANKAFSYTHVQRTCRVGYNQAQHTIKEMLRRNLIENSGHVYKLKATGS